MKKPKYYIGDVFIREEEGAYYQNQIVEAEYRFSVEFGWCWEYYFQGCFEWFSEEQIDEMALIRRGTNNI